MLPTEVLTLCQVFGAFPFRYRTTSNGQRVMEYMPLVFVWGLVIIVVQIAFSVYAMYVDIQNKDSGTIRMISSTSELVVCLDLGTLNLLVVVIIVGSAKKHHVFTKLCKIVDDIDNLMMQNVKSKPKGGLKTIVLYVLVVCFLLISAQAEKNYWEIQNRKNPGIYWPVYFTYFVHTAMFLHYRYVTKNLSFCFKILNDRMKRVLIKNSFGLRKRGNWIANVEDPEVSGNDSDIREIKTLMEVYWLLCAAVKQTNAFYSCQLLVAVFTSFIHLINTLYYLIINMLPIVQPDEVPYLVLLFLWAMFHTAQLMFLVWPSTEITEAIMFCQKSMEQWSSASIVYKECKWKERTIKGAAFIFLSHCMLLKHAVGSCISQPCATLCPIYLPLFYCIFLMELADETSQVICRFINKNLNPDIENLLDEFLLQLRHHNARLSAVGLFPIHRHILTSIAGSVTTYLVILVQFHISQLGKQEP